MHKRKKSASFIGLKKSSQSEVKFWICWG